ncbi:protein FAM50 [Monoraphidium neglectum]|uniref:Protein FAM50 n=1 Tax=Monoraphidium neglectum TaxID=145388 RepID=A0A0D2JMI7_9CHLO|nr:protein FAM50 [Monoraphidium neglectum]KIZ00403.1 protein FAM50 [Monoraphidium neglectum]|eukprot:XP_013899422.1 protein FAM50 [Monoraphidium neglectum]
MCTRGAGTAMRSSERRIVTEDIRILNDASVEKTDAHAGKIVDRHWYERNKHIFPASRWETYDPEKVWDTYTTHGHEVQTK